MSYILKGLLALLKGLPRVARFIPIGMAGGFLVLQFIIELFTKGVAYAFAHLSQSVFAAELTINRAVHLAIQDSPEYNFAMFLSIIVAVYVLIALVRWITKLQVKFGGAQAPWSAAILAIAVTAIIEMATIRAIDGVWGFVPIKDGLFYLVVNLKPVFMHIF